MQLDMASLHIHIYMYGSYLPTCMQYTPAVCNTHCKAMDKGYIDSENTQNGNYLLLPFSDHMSNKTVQQLVTCGDLQPPVCLSRGDGAIQRPPEHLWMSDKLKKQATAKAVWAIFNTNTYLNCQLIYVQISSDGEKCVLLLCAWKPVFVYIGALVVIIMPVKKLSKMVGNSASYSYTHSTVGVQIDYEQLQNHDKLHASICFPSRDTKFKSVYFQIFIIAYAWKLQAFLKFSQISYDMV